MRIALALALVVVAACDWSLHRMQREPGCRAGRDTMLLPGGACTLSPPQGAVPFQPVVAAPPAATRSVVERGHDRFDRYCAACHGVAADGSSQVGRSMTLLPPPTLVSGAVVQKPDSYYLTVMRSGRGVMPAYGSLVTKRDRYAILYYLRALQQRDVPLASLPPALQQEAKRWLP